MFGYIRPVTAELKVKEYELYRSVYCGLCRALGKCTGCASKLTLNYDFVFLALVRMALSGESGHIEKFRCAVHPVKRRSVLCDAKELEVCAGLSACLTYHKLCDDICDSRGARKIGYRCLMPAASGMVRRAGLDLKLEEAVRSLLEKLDRLEKNGCERLDEVAEVFGELMMHICSYGYAENSAESRISAQVGRHVGRFVYVIDAVDDLGDDIKNGTYNPLAEAYTRSGRLDTDRLRLSLTMELSELSKTLELIDYSVVYEYGAIIRNIVYLGLPEVIDKTLGKYTDNSEK